MSPCGTLLGLETDMMHRRIYQRLKQIGIGKETIGYRNYIRCIPHHERDHCPCEDLPRTPRVTDGSSKRVWDLQLRQWRRKLHRWDEVFFPNETEPLPSTPGSPSPTFDGVYFVHSPYALLDTILSSSPATQPM